MKEIALTLNDLMKHHLAGCVKAIFPDGWADFSLDLALITGLVAFLAPEWGKSHFYFFLFTPLIISGLYVRFLYQLSRKAGHR